MEILLYGLTNLLISKGFAFICSKVSKKIVEDTAPEIVYYYPRKKNNNKYSKIFNYLSLGLYFIPVVGKIYMGLGIAAGLIFSGFTIAVCCNKKIRQSMNTSKRLLEGLDSPEQVEKEILAKRMTVENLENMLTLDGADKKTKNEEYNKAKLDIPKNYLNEGFFRKVKQRKQNLILLDEFKDKLAQPAKAYAFTLDKKIQSVDINEKYVTISVSNLDAPENEDNYQNEIPVKVKTKSFKLR